MKYHITSNGKNGFWGGTVFRTANKVTLEVWEQDWPLAELALLAILDTFAKRGHKITYRKKGKWKKLKLPPKRRGVKKGLDYEAADEVGGGLKLTLNGL